eukprot:CAMPEP_0170539552 /NCGR_PEP_ID=MMETSP0209-20121228/104014_1 /TAXON_ID=665100 ORGANISM="Litonotus pictus, Strain P1" /NCGR_SAMPLE_ID=MMETSP0209 /ASSEMBLY_ACC=CAM_ASM_000301 /LENGTH=930 /DNA_ID=CAMNT_0010841537 /DNA_START=751 /DNA_END=3540 /DNA_ORIENTATION=-
MKQVFFHESLVKPFYYFAIFCTNRRIQYTIVDMGLEDFNYEKSLGPDYFIKGMKIDYRERICAYCKQPAKKRCSSCKEAYYCDQEHQALDWSQRHKYYCLGVSSPEDQEYSEVLYKNDIWSFKRKGIILHFKSCNEKAIRKGGLLCINLIQQNKKLLNLVMKSMPSLLKSNTIKNNNFMPAFTNYFSIVEDYTVNHFLWAYGNILINDKQEALTIINKFNRELEEKIEFKKIIDLILEGIKFYSLKAEGNYKRNIKLLESIFLRFIKLITSFGKMFYYLGEHEFFLNFIVEYTVKIEKFCQYIQYPSLIAKTYYYLGNLFIELDKLSYTITLYTEAIRELTASEKDRQEIREARDGKEANDWKDHRDFNLLIALNFNLGLVYFVTDQFKNSIVKLEKSLKLIEEKGESCSDQASNIYEVLGEIHLEYKNYNESLINLNKALEIKNKMIQESPMKKSLHEKSITKILIMIDIINQTLITNEEAEKITYKQKRKTQTIETANKLGMNLLKRINTGTNFSKNNPKSKLMNNCNDLFDYVGGIQTHGAQINPTKFNFTTTMDDHLNSKSLMSYANNNKTKFNNPSNSNEAPINSNAFNVKNIESIKKKYVNEIKKQQNSLNQEKKDEIEKFYIFISRLNSRQVDLLNIGQTHMNYNLPIVFSPDFKNELKHVQKLELADFNMILLTRCNILKNPVGRIEESNLNYDAIYHDDNKNNMSSIKNFFVTNKILKNWESTIGNAPTNTPNILAGKKGSLFGLQYNQKAYEKENMNPVNNNNIERKVMASERQLIALDKKESNRQATTPVSGTPEARKSFINYDKMFVKKNKDQGFSFEEFKMVILNYISQNNVNGSESVFSKINDNTLFKLSKSLSQEELIYLMKEPQIFYEFLDNQEILSSEESEVEEVIAKEVEEAKDEESHQYEEIEEVDESVES